MLDEARAARRPAALRLGRALVVSTAAHGFVLANLTFSPLLQGMPASAQPLTVLLADAPLAAAPAVPSERPTAIAAAAPAERPAPKKADDQPSAPALPAQEVFYRSSELDRRAEPLFPVDVEYPPQALASRTRGTVQLRLFIDHRGELVRAEVISAVPAGVFEAAAIKAARALRFRPALRNGAAVGSIKLIEVPFDPDCTVTGSCEK